MAKTTKGPGSKPRVGLKDIAQSANVSISTVSHVINRTAPISEDVRERVMQAARETGYLGLRREREARGGIRKVLLASSAYGLAENDNNLFLWSILSALRARCEQIGVKLLPHSPPGDHLSAEGIIRAANDERADGVLLIHDDRRELLALLSERREELPPVVLINGEDPDMGIDTVSPQNRFAAFKATRWLTEIGHRNILHVTWHGRTTISRRRDGFLDGMAEIGVRPENAPIFAFSGPDAWRAQPFLSDKLIEQVRSENITAIFCGADDVALRVHRSLHKAGYKVPEDISLMGFDNIVHAEMSSPPLASVAVPVGHIGPVALKLLEERLSESFGPSAPARRVELACTLIKRASVAPLR
ncbi:LacI family DNA-binding transcriptional regulator [Martelella radicis]|uniref:DNA-binding LacI/PurR family transcriptional regulator n=1 Tax=Martelella radicis TaxID=1397476 RepID=A0A7W6KM31_9HYPH|nr:LacI family DNA-binding transcriptional regulator [Martelella radicis]MBB4123736.1 DNA-binding LacI/PurR family transcriptional regulator [Martelella radicis]